MDFISKMKLEHVKTRSEKFSERESYYEINILKFFFGWGKTVSLLVIFALKLGSPSME
jgi:hypothetical protein